jgi:hypothetical protein
MILLKKFIYILYAVVSSVTIIVIVNFRRICGYCTKKNSNIETVANPVNEWK